MSNSVNAFEENLLKNINNQLKNNQMVKLTDDSVFGRPRGWIDTGIYALNWVISGDLNGGWPVGRISELDGDPGTGKSLLCAMAMKDPTIDSIIFFDTEAALNVDFLKFLNIDNTKILYQPIDTVEELIESSEIVLNTIEKNKEHQKKILMIIDSIALASTSKEMDPDSGSDMGYKARKLREFFRKFARKIEKFNIALLVTNHYTMKIGVAYGNPRTTTGGTALPYAASVRVDLKVTELDIDKKLESVGASQVTIRAKTEKNRHFSPKRRIYFVLDFVRGVNKYSGLFKILLDLGLANKNGAWCSLPSWDPEKKFYAKDFPEIVEKNNLMPVIQELLDNKIENGDPEMDEVVEEEIINLGENNE